MLSFSYCRVHPFGNVVDLVFQEISLASKCACVRWFLFFSVMAATRGRKWGKLLFSARRVIGCHFGLMWVITFQWPPIFFPALFPALAEEGGRGTLGRIIAHKWIIYSWR